MAIPSFKDWEKDTTKKDTIVSTNSSATLPSFKQWSGDKAPIAPVVTSQDEEERKKLIEAGEPVSTKRRFERTGKNTPSMGGSFIRDIVKLPLRLAATVKNIGEAAGGREAEDLKVSDYFGKVERIGKGFDVTQGLTKQNLKALGDSAAAGAELASYFIGAKPLTSLGGTAVKQLTKQEIKRKILKEALRVAKYEATAGGLGAGGHAVQEGKDLKGIVTDVLVGTILGGGLGLGLGGLGAKLKLGKEAKILEKIPEDEATIKIEEAVAEAQKPVEVAPKVESSEITKAIEESTAPKAQEVTASATEEIIPAGKEVPSTRGEKLLDSAVEKKLIDSYEGDNPTHVEENAGKWASDANKFIDENPDYMDVATGKKSHPNSEAIYTAAEIRAMQDGDVEKIFELSRSSVPTEAGRGLKKLDSTDPSSPVQIIRKLNKALQEKVVKKVGKSIKKASEDIVTKLKKTARKTSLKRQDWESFVKSIQC